MSTSVIGLLWILGLAAVAGLAGLLIRRIGSGQGPDKGDTAEDNTAASSVFTLVAGLHAVLMVFVLIALFDKASTAEADSYREANNLVAVSWAGDALPEPARTRIHTLTREYVNTVIDREWPRMRAAKPEEDTGWVQLDEVRLAIQQADTTDEWQQDQRTEAAARLWDVYQARQDRLSAASGGVSLVVWFALAIGSVLSLVLLYRFSGTTLVTHVLVMSTMAAMIALVLYAIYQMQNPFSGGAHIDPDAFRAALDRLS
jgi:Protein of unknown function (DUF4239)